MSVADWYARHAFILLQNLPRGSYISIDQHAYRTDTSFEGFKLVPPGIHCIAWQSAAASADDGDRHDGLSEGIRSIWFFYVQEETVLVRMYDATSDTWMTAPGTGAETPVIVSRDHLQSMDRHLAAYPMDSSPLWHRLTRFLQLSRSTIDRVFGIDTRSADATCDSFTPVTDRNARSSLRELRTDPRLQEEISLPGLAFTSFSLSHSWPPEAHGEERTRWNMDKSWLLEHVMQRACDAEKVSLSHEPLLREFELCFLLFRCTSNAAALDHWMAMVSLFSRAAAYIGAPTPPHTLHPCEWDTALPSHVWAPRLEAHRAWIQTLVSQFEALPSTIWTEDLLTFEAQILEDMASLRTNISRSLGAWAATSSSSPSTEHEQLVQAWRKLSAMAQKQFEWSLDYLLDEEVEADDAEEGEDAPVIVHMS